jgi:hypothetical protein
MAMVICQRSPFGPGLGFQQQAGHAGAEAHLEMRSAHLVDHESLAGSLKQAGIRLNGAQGKIPQVHGVGVRD